MPFDFGSFMTNFGDILQAGSAGYQGRYGAINSIMARRAHQEQYRQQQAQSELFTETMMKAHEGTPVESAQAMRAFAVQSGNADLFLKTNQQLGALLNQERRQKGRSEFGDILTSMDSPDETRALTQAAVAGSIPVGVIPQLAMSGLIPTHEQGTGISDAERQEVIDLISQTDTAEGKQTLAEAAQQLYLRSQDKSYLDIAKEASKQSQALSAAKTTDPFDLGLKTVAGKSFEEINRLRALKQELLNQNVDTSEIDAVIQRINTDESLRLKIAQRKAMPVVTGSGTSKVPTFKTKITDFHHDLNLLDKQIKAINEDSPELQNLLYARNEVEEAKNLYLKEKRSSSAPKEDTLTARLKTISSIWNTTLKGAHIIDKTLGKTTKGVKTKQQYELDKAKFVATACQKEKSALIPSGDPNTCIARQSTSYDEYMKNITIIGDSSLGTTTMTPGTLSRDKITFDEEGNEK